MRHKLAYLRPTSHICYALPRGDTVVGHHTVHPPDRFLVVRFSLRDLLWLVFQGGITDSERKLCLPPHGCNPRLLLFPVGTYLLYLRSAIWTSPLAIKSISKKDTDDNDSTRKSPGAVRHCTARTLISAVNLFHQPKTMPLDGGPHALGVCDTVHLSSSSLFLYFHFH